MNESALSLEKRFQEFQETHLKDNEIMDTLNKLGIPPPKGKCWTEGCVQKVSERIRQIHDIIRFNEFVMELIPLLEKYPIDKLTEEVFTKELHQAGVRVSQSLSAS